MCQEKSPTHRQPNTSTPANKGMWQAMAFGQVSPDLTLQEVWRRALRHHRQYWRSVRNGTPLVTGALSLVCDARQHSQTHSRAAGLTLSL